VREVTRRPLEVLEDQGLTYFTPLQLITPLGTSRAEEEVEEGAVDQALAAVAAPEAEAAEEEAAEAVFPEEVAATREAMGVRPTRSAAGPVVESCPVSAEIPSAYKIRDRVAALAEAVPRREKGAAARRVRAEAEALLAETPTRQTAMPLGAAPAGARQAAGAVKQFRRSCMPAD
jgi:hypothetical protein